MFDNKGDFTFPSLFGAFLGGITLFSIILIFILHIAARKHQHVTLTLSLG